MSALPQRVAKQVSKCLEAQRARTAQSKPRVNVKLGRAPVGPEDAIPDRKDHAKIFRHVSLVGAVVKAMHAWGYQHQLQVPDKAGRMDVCVLPDIEEEGQEGEGRGCFRRNSHQQDHANMADRGNQRLDWVEAQRRTGIDRFVGMVQTMRPPKRLGQPPVLRGCRPLALLAFRKLIPVERVSEALRTFHVSIFAVAKGPTKVPQIGESFGSLAERSRDCSPPGKSD